jgi:hypothetical protein
LDVHRILLSRVETNLTPDVFFDNEKTCDDQGLENSMDVHFYKWYAPDVLPSNGIPTGFTDEELKGHITQGGVKPEVSVNQSVLNDLSWRPLYDQMVKHDASGEEMKNNAMQSDPAEIFLNNFQLPFASAWPGWKPEHLDSTEKFFEKLKDL